MKVIFPLVVISLSASALTGCSSAQNEAPCKEFESTYNAVDLRDKLIVIDDRGKDYRPSLKKLADTARSASQKAGGEVKENLTSYVAHAEAYEKTLTETDLAYDFLDVRGWLEEARDSLVESCEASGYPISLEPDHPVR